MEDFVNKLQKDRISVKSKQNWENLQLAERMMNGLRKGTETMRQRGKNNYVESNCVICGNIIKHKPYNKPNKCCSKECLLIYQQTNNPGLKIANQKNLENLEQRQKQIREIAINWVKENSEIVQNSKMNKLGWLNEIMQLAQIEDQRTLAKAFGVTGRKALVNYFKEIIN